MSETSGSKAPRALAASDERPKWQVRECRDDDDRERLFRFRYVEFVEKQGLFRGTADHKNRRLTDAIDVFGVNFLAEADDTIIGSFRMNGFDKFVPTFCITSYDVTALGPEVFKKGCYIAHAIVHPDWRKSPLFIDLALAVAKRVRDDGKRWMFIGTATARKAGEEEQFISAYGSIEVKVWRRDADVPGIGKGTALLLDLEEAMADPQSLVHLYLGGASAGA